ncbi:MAG: TSUP family transporter, partial [Dehalococcoidia bacterium]
GLFVGASGFASHALAGNLDVALIVALGGTGMVGSYLGARTTGRMDADALRLAIGIVLLVISPVMAYRSVLEFPG